MIRHFLSMNDISNQEFISILDSAKKLKSELKSGIPHPVLKNKILAMLFEKPSTRTRVSFESGMTQLGGHAMFLDFSTLQTSRVETIEDTARILSGYSDLIMARLFKHDDIIKIAENSKVPVINGLTDVEHPCQALADLLTVREHKGFEKTTLAYIGDAANNVCHSLMIACAKAGINIKIGCPEKYKPHKWAINSFNKTAKDTNAKILITNNPEEAVKDSDVVYTDVWVSMGDEKEEKKRVEVLKPYQVSKELMKKAKSDAVFMHDLPAHRGYEVTNEVLDSPQSIVFDQAENRMHVQKALMCFLLQ